MSPTVYALAGTAVALAAFIQGTIGVGFALIVAPVLGFLASDSLPAALLVLMLPLNAYVAWRERADLDLRAAGWITAGRAAGTFGGLWIITALPMNYLNVLVGAATILAAGVTLAAPTFHANRRAFVGAGIVTGITETATGIGGPPLALVLQHHAAAVLRSTIAACFLVGELVSLLFLGVAGRAGRVQLSEALLLTPPLALGLLLSRHTHSRVQGRSLRLFVMVFAIASGIVLIVR